MERPSTVTRWPTAEDRSEEKVGVQVALVSAESVIGVIVPGDKRGRQLGFPTANIALAADYPSVRDGVYSGLYSGGDVRDRPSAVSIGRRPTFYAEGTRLLEAHLLDFSGDLYGQLATVRLVRFLRPQRSFQGLPDLRAQLSRDVERVRKSLTA